MHPSIRTVRALALALGVISSPTIGQDETVQPMHTSVYEVSPKPGHALNFEEALKQQVEWAEQQNSNWGWNVFEITAGKRVGNYLFVSGNHSWEDYDENQEFGTRARARWRAEVSRHVKSVEGGIYRLLADYSRIPENVDTYPFALVSFFSVPPTSTRSYRQSLRKITDAMKTQESAPPALWFQQVSGGEQGTFLNMRPFEKWTDWPNRAAARAMTKAMDPEKTRAIIEELAKVILREETSVIALRPDLSLTFENSPTRPAIGPSE